jgi:antirestriction protein
MAHLNSLGCEEVEIQLIDADTHQHCLLADSAGLGQCDIETWYDEIEDLDEHEADQVLYLLDCGYTLSEALRRHDEVSVWYGSAEDYAYELYQDCYDIPEHLAPYIDYQAIARDLRLGGDIAEIRDGAWCTNASEF